VSAALPPGKRLAAHFTGVCAGLVAGWDGFGILAPTEVGAVIVPQPTTKFSALFLKARYHVHKSHHYLYFTKSSFFWHISLRFSDRGFVCISYVAGSCYIPSSSHPSV
jgi:hypothetical protein